MHKPVLQKEVLEYLDPKPNDNFIDCTINGGGHGLAILDKIKPQGKVLGIDLDRQVIKNLKAQKKERLVLVNDSYVNLEKIVKDLNFKPVNGILFDLGMSSWQLETSGRGFSFLKDEPLDMRYNDQSDLKAEDIINNYPQEDITKILEDYGEEKHSKRIAKEIIKQRKIKPIKTTFELNEVIKRAILFKYKGSKIHFATRTFQALRIAVNDELNNLKKTLPQTIDILEPKARLVLISFHSLEDRIIKNFFKDSNKKLKILLKKPVTPTIEEIKNNPRSRSAKLRVAVKNI